MRAGTAWIIQLKWLSEPAEKKPQATPVNSLKAVGYYDFNDVIGYPFAA